MRVVVISGYFNPIHSGHIEYIKAASRLGDKLVVIVNSDEQVKIKGSEPFMDEVERMKVAGAFKGVDRVILSVDEDESVVETIKLLHNEYELDYFFDKMCFCNGGDRTKGNSPEEQYCEKKGIHTVYNVGGGKTQSSSSILATSKIRNV